MKPNQIHLCFALVLLTFVALAAKADSSILPADKPEISVKRGFYKHPFDVSISSPIPGMQVYYTLDGSDPRSSATAKTTSSPAIVRIDPNSTIQRGKTPAVVLRAAVIKDNYVFSPVATRSYIFVNYVKDQTVKPGHDWPAGSYVNDQEIDLLMDPEVTNNPDYADLMDDALLEIPSFSIVTDNKNLFAPDSGIYVNAWDNRGEEWERPASIELIYPDGTKGFQIDAGLRIRGGWSRHGYFRKHAFRFFFSSKYGEANLHYPLFGEEGTNEFDKVDLRCSQNYSWSKGENEAPYCTFNRDVFSRDLQREMGHAYTRSRYYHLYLNGLYWGLFQTQERSESSFAASYYGGSASDYDVIKHAGGADGIEVNDGTIDAWQEIWDLCEEGFKNNDNYYRIQGLDANGERDPNLKVLVDIDNLIDYMNVIFYTGNFDGPFSSFSYDANNFYAIYNPKGQEGFKFFAHDNEHTLLMDRINVGQGLNEDRVNFGPEKNDKRRMTVTSIEHFQPQWLHYKLSLNPEYRSRFADRAYELYYNHGILTPEKTAQLFMNRALECDTAVIAESARWGDVDGGLPYTKNEHWDPMIERTMNEYFPYRTAIVIDQLKYGGLLPSLDVPEFRINNELLTDNTVEIYAGEQLTLRNGNGAGSIKYTVNGDDPRLPGGNIAVSAVDGENLTDLSVLQNTVIKARVYNDGEWSPLHTIHLKVNQISSGLQITEIHYHPTGGNDISGNEFEFLELKNSGTETIHLVAATFKGIQYTFKDEATINPGEFFVLASNSEAFNSRYGFNPDGEYEGQLDNGGERITLLGVAGDTIVSVKYNDNSPWPTVADGLGFSIVPAVDDLNADWDDGDNWRPSSAVNGSPGADDAPVEMQKIFINEVLANTEKPLVDAIELYNPNDHEINIGYWYLTDDKSKPKKWQIPEGTIIGTNDYAVFYAGHYNGDLLESSANEFGAAFGLSSHGDDVYLYSGNSSNNLTGYDHHYDFPDSDPGVSFGRYEISTGKIHFVAMNERTLGETNGHPKVGPVVINQLMYHPLDEEFEYMELVNISGETVNFFEETSLVPWKVAGINFDFPEGFSLLPGASVYLIEDAVNPDDFRFIHNLEAAVPVFNYEGKLDNGGEEITLYKSAPQYSEKDSTKSPYIRVDRVAYNDNSKWPDADGNGFLLKRTEQTAYGNDPGSWEAALPAISINNYPPAFATVGVSYSYQVLVSGGSTPINWLLYSGALPSGLSLNAATGLISGIPEEAGEFTFWIEATDQLGSSDEIEYTLIVNENTVPVAVDDFDSTTMNIAVVVDVLANDVDEDGDLMNCVLSISEAPKNGTAQVNPNQTVTYSPKNNFMGTDSLVYRIDDMNGFTEAKIVIEVGVEYVIATAETQISQSSDDASEMIASGKMNLTDAWVDMCYNITNGGWQLNGLRFQNVAVPKGAQLTKAYIQFTTEVEFDYESLMIIGCEDEDNPATYLADDKNIRNRNYYQEAYAEWMPEPWMLVDEAGVKQQSPDLSALVQHLIDREGWVENNAMAFVVQPADQGGLRIAYSYDGNPELAPVLHIEYIVEEGPVLEPVAMAGANQNVALSTAISLDGSASYSPDGRLLNYHWVLVEKPEGSLAELDNNTVVNPMFTADEFGDYSFTLMVDNGHVESSLDTVIVKVEDLLPVANAGPDQERIVGAEIHLNGSNSYDPEMKNLNFNWTMAEKPAASKAALNDSTSMSPVFVADVAGTYTLRLTVNDGRNNSNPDLIEIQVNENQLPVALAGDDLNVFTGARVKLDASLSYDPEEYVLEYFWTLKAKPEGSAAVLSDSGSVAPTFLADSAGTYLIELVVSDGVGFSTADEVVVTVNKNSAPVANAGPDQDLTHVEIVYLDGSASSDPDGTALNYLWTFVTKPAGSYVPLMDANTVNPSFAPDAKGLYTVRLVVSDGIETISDDVQIMVNSTTAVLTVDLGNSIKVYPNPFSGKLKVEFDKEISGVASFELYNVSGTLIAKQRHDQVSDGSLELDFANNGLKNGVYLFMVKAENQPSKVFRLMYQNE